MVSCTKGTMENPYSMSEYKIYVKTTCGKEVG